MNYLPNLFLCLLIVSLLACNNLRENEQATGTLTDTIQQTDEIQPQQNVTPTAEIEQEKSTAEIKEARPNTLYFKATGNEPFWHLQIYGDQHLNLSFLAEEEVNFGMPISTENITLNTDERLIYEVQSEDKNLKVIIEKVNCIDNMSGEKFPYSVEIDLNQSADNYKFSGCGKYNGDYRLHDIWAISRMNEEEVEYLKTFPPGFELNLSAGRVVGSTECNDFNATIKLDMDSISFGEINSTDETCPGSELEKRFYNFIQERTYQFSFGENQLILQSDKDKLVFNKVF